MFSRMPDCLVMSYSRAKQHPGSCYSKQQTCHLRSLRTSGHQVPPMEGFSKIPVAAAAHQAG